MNEKLTGYSWDSFKNSYVDTLKDLTSTTENFADNIEELLTNAILNSLVNEAYKDRISELYRMIADAAGDESEGGTSFTSNELQAIRDYNEQLAADLVAARDALEASGAIKSAGGSGSVSSSIKGITEQTADMLAGYINAIRGDVSVNRETLTKILQTYQNEIPVIAQAQLVQLEALVENAKAIAQYTASTASNTARIDEIYSLLYENTIGVNRFNIK